jgi:hypothetical protein
MTMLSLKISIRETSILATTTATKTHVQLVREVAAEEVVAEEVVDEADAIATKQPIQKVTIEHREVAVATTMAMALKIQIVRLIARSADAAEVVGEIVIVIVMMLPFQKILIANRVAAVAAATKMMDRKSRIGQIAQGAVVTEDAVATTPIVIAMKFLRRTMHHVRADAPNAIGTVTLVTARNLLPIHVKTESQLGRTRSMA